MEEKRRIVVVANRLPFTVVKEGDKLNFTPSSGGLVSAMNSFLESWKGEFLWIGWPGATILEKQGKTVIEKAAGYRSYPVFLPGKVMEKFYQGFCNKTIWPLFHYFPLLTSYDEDQWETYKAVNKAFYDACLEVVRPDDILWVHDYQLMLLPKLLRNQFNDASIGYFLHIPFPSYEMFRLIPRKWGAEILDGILGSDLIGFHTNEYSQYFLRNVLRMLGHDHNLGQIVLPTRLVKVDTFPLGVDFKKFGDAYKRDDVKKEEEDLGKILSGKKVIFSVDRLDYTKGIINRLMGYEVFLEKNPAWHGKIVFILVVVPSRVSVEHYQNMKNKIDELVGRINGKYGEIKWNPIIYKFRSLNFSELSALYGLSNIALITPLRDGMNLVAKEYVASCREANGVLILSEFAGAAKELGEAIIINPNHKEEIADAILEAAEMKEDERKRRLSLMQARLKIYDVKRWASDFMGELENVKEEQKKYEMRFLRKENFKRILEAFSSAKNRLILLDYDGTLVPFARDPSLAVPDSELMDVLAKLSQKQQTDLIIVSGRNKANLDSWFGDMSIDLVAEHGVWIKQKMKDWYMTKPLSGEWKTKLFPIMQLYAERLPGSFIEAKDYSLAWHYRNSDPEQSAIRVKEMIDDLTHFTANLDIQVLRGDKVVEIRSSGINKGTGIMSFLTKNTYDFILAIGDDWTDEDVFKVLPPDTFSIKVGYQQSYAKFNVPNYLFVRNLLKEIAF